MAQSQIDKNNKRKAEQRQIATWLNGGEPINMDAYITKLMRAVRVAETDKQKRAILKRELATALENLK